jgi:hypothetical protein
MNSRYRLPSCVVFALSSIIRHLSSVLCALCVFVVKLSFLRAQKRGGPKAAHVDEAEAFPAY